MRLVPLATSCALFAACFSKPENTTGGGEDPLALRYAAGGSHACVIDGESRLWCWGDNDRGQLGDRSEVATGTPGLASPETRWTAIAAGSDHTCGVRSGDVYCWGGNDQKQSDPTSPSSASSMKRVVLPTGLVATKVFAGPTATCAIATTADDTASAHCWGQLDLELGATLYDVTELMPGTAFSQIAIADDHACAIGAGGAGPLYCWGVNNHQQTGSPESGDFRFAQAKLTVDDSRFTSVAAAHRTTCATTQDGKLACFGDPVNGHHGEVSGPSRYRIVDDNLRWTRVAMGGSHVCAIGDGQVYCYGDDTDGAIGSGVFAGRRTVGPRVVDAASSIIAGDSFSCAIGEAEVSCWGSNRKGELGNGQIASSRAPVLAALGVTPTDVVTQIAAGDGHSCAVIAVAAGAYVVKCWGDNRARQVDSLATFADTPRVSAMDLKSISAGGLHTCGLQADGSNVRCWGSNQSAELGTPASSTGPHMVPRPNGGPWTSVAAGSTASCAIAGTELHCWGSTPDEGMPMSAAPPTRVSDTSHAWSGIVLGSGFGAGIVDAGEVGGFGRGCPYGSMNMDYTAYQNLPIATEPEPFQLAAAQAQGEHLCMHAAGPPPRIVCWGSNAQRQIDSTSITPGCYQNEDTEAPPGGWVAPAVGSISIAGGHSCAIGRLTSGSEPRVFCWGSDDTGLLGFGPNNAGTPFKVSDLNVSQVSTAANHTCVIARASGDPMDSVYCWGENKYGQLGNGTRFHAEPTPALVMP
jgi:alpha-tubulin suppressor-like RCC1 family protein